MYVYANLYVQISFFGPVILIYLFGFFCLFCELLQHASMHMMHVLVCRIGASKLNGTVNFIYFI